MQYFRICVLLPRACLPCVHRMRCPSSHPPVHTNRTPLRLPASRRMRRPHHAPVSSACHICLVIPAARLFPWPLTVLSSSQREGPQGYSLCLNLCKQQPPFFKRLCALPGALIVPQQIHAELSSSLSLPRVQPCVHSIYSSTDLGDRSARRTPACHSAHLPVTAHAPLSC